MTPPYRQVPLRRRSLTARYLQEGRGDPVLYLHGAIASRGWNPFLEELAREFTVYAPLQPGFEEVEGLESLSDVIDLALYYFDLLDELGLSEVNVVGHFLGGMIAAEMAALCPHYVKSLVLAAPAGFWRDDSPVPDIFIMGDGDIRSKMWYDPQSPSALATVPQNGTDEEQTLRRLERTIDLAAAGKFLWPIPDRGLVRRIHRIKAPALLVWGEEDQIVSPVYAEEFSSRLAHSQKVTLARCGHLPMLEQPDQFAGAVKEFFHQR